MSQLISLEGNVHAGKSSYLEKKKSEGFEVLSEIPSPIYKSFVLRQLHYLFFEIKRKLVFKSNGYLDRSYLSLFSFQAYSGKLYNLVFESIILLLSCLHLLLNPNYLYFFLIPYKKTEEFHSILREKKQTATFLIEYDYFVFQVLFFSNLVQNEISIEQVEPFRYIIKGMLRKDIRCHLFQILRKGPLKPYERIFVDGPTASGKSTISMKFSMLCLPEPKKYKKFSLSHPTNQLDLIIKRRHEANRNADIVMDTGFLSSICYLFYSKGKVSSDTKLIWVETICKGISPLFYTTNIIYLLDSVENLYIKMNNDNERIRNHFQNNISFKKEMDNFFISLHKELGDISPIEIVKISDNNYTRSNLNKCRVKKKPVLIIDILFCISELIVKGCI